MQATHLFTPPSERLSARWLHRRLIIIYLVDTSIAVVVGVILYVFGLDLNSYQMFTYASFAPLACAPMILLDILVINTHFRPVGVFLRTLPEQPKPVVSTSALVRALNLPILTALRLVLVHLPAIQISGALLIFWANHYLNLGLRAGQFFTFLFLTTFVATGHAIFEYFAVAATIRPVIRLIWPYCDGLTSQQRRRIIPLGMRRKLLSVSAFVVFIPLLVLGVSVLVKVNVLLVELGVEDIGQYTAPLRMWIILLIAGSTALMLFLSVMMAREVTRSADEMVQAMHRVENEELDTRLTVTTTDEFGALYEGFNHMTSGLQERERLRDAFGRYVAPELAEEVMRHGVRLGGETVNASVLFADIRGFTALSEQMTSIEIVSLLNRYLAAVEPAIRAEGGWINKFGGDSLLAIFGAPVPQTDHAQRATRAAQGIRAALSEFNERQRKAGEPTLRIGIGIHCGKMVAGSVGSPKHMEYTVIGDVVNVASRIEALNKKWGTDALVSAEAYGAIGTEVSVKAMPLAKVPGRAEPLQVYALE